MFDSGSILFNKSHAFAVAIVKFYDKNYRQKFSVIYRQLLNSATSIGANTSEANGAISEDDFSAKVSIAFKEMRETKYWLLLMKDTDLLDTEVYNKFYNQVDELCKIAFSILKSTGRINPKRPPTENDK
jgi:four helix bundle protein